MFAVRSQIQRIATRRMASVAAPKNKIVPDVYQYSFKKEFLSDPSTYPLMVVMTLATTVMVGMSANALMRYKGVKISSQHKNSILREWDDASQRQVKVTEVITRQPIGFHAQSFKDIRAEGLGVNHEEWKKSKEAHN